jgi:hypothetical protein
MLRNRTLCVGAFRSLEIWVVGQANEIGSLLKRKFEHWKHPHVVNANHNNYPPICALVSDYPIVFLPQPLI